MDSSPLIPPKQISFRPGNTTPEDALIITYYEIKPFHTLTSGRLTKSFGLRTRKLVTS